MSKLVGDVVDFFKKFDIMYNDKPRLLPKDLYEFRKTFLFEELNEYIESCEKGDLEGALDALVDLVYVAIGTAIFHGFDFDRAWDIVHATNMTKVKAKSETESKRNSIYDIVKPEGWKKPDLSSLILSVVKKPTWEEYFLSFLQIIGSRANCDRGYNAALIVDNDNQVVSTGYVGAPPGLPECNEVGHLLFSSINVDGKKTMHCKRTVHAEVNAIAQAAKRGVSTKNCTLYVKLFPCYDCAKLIISSGISKIVSLYDYHASEFSKNLFALKNIEYKIINNGVYLYEK